MGAIISVHFSNCHRSIWCIYAIQFSPMGNVFSYRRSTIYLRIMFIVRSPLFANSKFSDGFPRECKRFIYFRDMPFSPNGISDEPSALFIRSINAQWFVIFDDVVDAFRKKIRSILCNVKVSMWYLNNQCIQKLCV